MRDDPIGALQLPEIEVPEPAGSQIKIDLKREGTLVWMIQQMAIEARGYEQNVLGADLKDPAKLSQVIDWQARRQVLEQWLDRLVTLVTKEDSDGN
jgi:hypothetical protein